MMIKRTFLYLLLCVTISFLAACDSSIKTQEKTAVIYSSDLFHPHGDMDDQVDLAALYGLPDIDIKLVILDHGKSQLERPGLIPVRQMNRLTGRDIRAEIGLTYNLQNLQDQALEQEEQFQGAVKALIEVMETTAQKVVIITVGSLRDIAAAYNRSPELFHEKVDKVLIFAGEASKKNFVETNVKMDRFAFATIMNSDLPVYWVPCFDGGLWQNRGRASYWQTTYEKILQDVPDSLLKYFLYAAKRSKDDPFLFLDEEIDINLKNKLFRTARNLWSCSLFYIASGKTVTKTDKGYDVVPVEKARDKDVVFDFAPVNIEASSNGEIKYLKNNEGHKVMQFRIRKRAEYKAIMTDVARDLIRSAVVRQEGSI